MNELKPNSSLSIVIPVYNSEKILAKIVKEILDICRSRHYNFEVILVDDSSQDGSWQKAKELAKCFEEVKAHRLARNYGQSLANLWGFKQSKNDYIITMDDDGQNPPSEIPKLFEKAEEGHDLVIGKPISKQHGLLRNLGSRLVTNIAKSIYKTKEPLILSNYRCIHKSVIEKICNERNANPYLPALILKYSTQRTNINVSHKKRRSGQSNYSLLKLASLVANLLFGHSVLPLRIAIAVGFTFSLLTALVGVALVAHYLINQSNVPGWTSVMVFMAGFCSIVVLILSTIGEYIIRILQEVTGSRAIYTREEVLK